MIDFLKGTVGKDYFSDRLYGCQECIAESQSLIKGLFFILFPLLPWFRDVSSGAAFVLCIYECVFLSQRYDITASRNLRVYASLPFCLLALSIWSGLRVKAKMR